MLISPALSVIAGSTSSMIISSALLALILTGLTFFCAITLLLVVFALRCRKRVFAHKDFALIGRTAFVERSLDPEGAVLVGGELWRARSRDMMTINRGSRTRVLRTLGHLLEVEPHS